MLHQTNYGIPPLKLGDEKVNVMRIVRTVVGFAILGYVVLVPQPDITTLIIKAAIGLLLVDVTLFGVALKALKNGKAR